MHRPRRIALRFLLAAVLGALTTAGIAWGIALFGSSTSSTNRHWVQVQGDKLLYVEESRAWGSANRYISEADYLVGATDEQRAAARARWPSIIRTQNELGNRAPPRWLWWGQIPGPGANWMRPDCGVGWPVIAMWFAQGAGPTNAMGSPPVAGGLDLGDHLPSSWWRFHRVLPLRIAPGGFTLCAVLYTAIWVSLLVFLGAARRALRRKRGHCPHCAYDLRSITAVVCPECGAQRPASRPPRVAPT